ncbi:prepilin-type N-terminal cleavage/methylation domain-containing protein [Ruficoccus amylovorans]|uniref:Prepilin-type N-terminal cleavage/methylation domain-containing protein n=1 Tax=Ruficoccus amylovorans TaxID=1804625 RepID=A0A842HBD2_9BACT|nr:prepilin-type N-terminal cleavage/methylation domain-containing protein [Ruficoccus amylovorans]MBC2592741.1 prepilin-type N-terminal cleavage/methylation domain-containing protein [Ruficoccus amylovorans]
MKESPLRIKGRAVAFTLIELLACVAIIGILSAIIFAGISHIRISSNKTSGITTMRSVAMALQIYTQDKGAMPGPTFRLQNALYNGKWGLVNYLAPYMGAPSDPTNTILDSFVPSPFLDYIKEEGNEQTIVYEANQDNVGTGPSGRSQSIWAHISAVQSQPANETPITPFNIYYALDNLDGGEFWMIRTSFEEARGHPEAEDIYAGERVVLFLDGHIEMVEDPDMTEE